MNTTEPKATAATLKSSEKYLAAEKLPRFDAATSFKEVYTQLNRMGYSGFILSAQGEVQGYVKADELAKRVVEKANGDAQALRLYSSQPIGKIIPDFEVALVPVLSAPADATESVLHDSDDTVFRVTQADVTVGWYLNHESVREPATRRTVFLCVNGHRNPDPDHGTCYRCPFPITRTETE